MFHKCVYHIGLMAFLREKYFEFIKEYKLLNKIQFEPINVINSIQRQRLYKLLKFAVTKVPFYSKIAKENKINVKKSTIFDDLRKFPILTKDLIRRNFETLHPDLRYTPYFLNTSGGTTGEPVEFIQDMRYRIYSDASTLFVNKIADHNIGDKLVWLWGSERDILEATKSYIRLYINRWIRNHYFLNAFRMSDSIMENYVKQINKIKPKTMLGYVQSVSEISKFISRTNMEIHRFNSIITSAGVLTNRIKRDIEETFKCKVFNRYGSREVGIIASSCEKSNKLHINMIQQYLEIEDSQYINQLNQKGNIIITNLINYAMPLIRFRIGDRASINYKKCPCGRNLLRLDNVFGRFVDVFKNERDELIDGEFFTHLFYFRKNIKKFQVIQEQINSIVVKIITLNGLKLDFYNEKDLRRKIRLVMGKNCKVSFEYVKEIDSSSSGKFRFTISQI